MYWLKDGTLLINNAHKASPATRAALAKLLQPAMADGTAAGMSTAGSMEAAAVAARPRFCLTAEQPVKEVEELTTVIKASEQHNATRLLLSACFQTRLKYRVAQPCPCLTT